MRLIEQLTCFPLSQNSTNFQNDGNNILSTDSFYHSLNNGVFINGFIPNSNIIDISGKDNNLISKKNNPTMLEEPTDEIWDRPKVYNPDGTISTAVSITIGIEYKDKDALAVIPTCYDGEIHSEQDAINRFFETHKHFGIFSNEEIFCLLFDRNRIFFDKNFNFLCTVFCVYY